MKSVLASFKPQYCELIASGKKTVELRKTRPKLDVPFKVYMYCTKRYYRKGDGYFQGKYCGKVIGEFVCDEIYTYRYSGGGYLINDDISTTISCRAQDCLTDTEFRNYFGEHDGYGWHISDLVIYDKPKELSEFYRKCNGIHCRGNACEHWKYVRVNADESEMDCDCNELPPITRPPQSWCYVEGEEARQDGV